MELKDEIVALLEKASKNDDDYQNPHLVQGVIETLQDVYGDDVVSEEITFWAQSLWSM